MQGVDPGTMPPGEWDLESTVLRLIAEAGEARGLVYEALDQALAGDREGAQLKLARADEHIRAAHVVQFKELIAREAAGERVPISLLVIHGMDLLMTTASERDLTNVVIQRGLDPRRSMDEDAGETR
jgi:cellobiose-specific phosphotransferase system component IIA